MTYALTAEIETTEYLAYAPNRELYAMWVDCGNREMAKRPSRERMIRDILHEATANATR